jgi:hypothetical protein
LFNDCHAEAAHRRIAGDAGADNSPADDEHIERLATEAGDRFAAVIRYRS